MSSDHLTNSVPFDNETKPAPSSLILVQSRKRDSNPVLSEWQRPLKLDKTFNPWAGFVQLCNVSAKLGAMAALPVDARPTAEFLVDTFSDHLFKTPKTVAVTVDFMIHDRKKLLRMIQHGFKPQTDLKELHYCAALPVESIVPKKVDGLRL